METRDPSDIFTVTSLLLSVSSIMSQTPTIQELAEAYRAQCAKIAAEETIKNDLLLQIHGATGKSACETCLATAKLTLLSGRIIMKNGRAVCEDCFLRH